MGMRPEAAHVLERNDGDSDKHFSYEWSKANRQPYVGGLLRAQHLEKSNAIAQRPPSGDFLVGLSGVVGPQDQDATGDEGRKRRPSPSVPPPLVHSADQRTTTPHAGGANNPPRRRSHTGVAKDTLPGPRGANGAVGTTTGGIPTTALRHGENPLATRRNGSPGKT